MDPLSRKVGSILAASYSDAEFRDVLAILDKRLLENSAEARRRLEVDIEREIISSNAKTIREFTKIADQLKVIGLTITRLNEACSEIKSRADSSAKETSAVSNEAASLISQLKEMEVKEAVLTSFKNHYVVSEDELVAMTSSAEPVNDDFFRTLERVKGIHRDCEFLLSSENQTAGMEIMEQTTKQLNFAFQKLYRWVQKEFKTLSLDNSRVNADLRKALRILAERPAVFQSCLDFFSEARQKLLVQAFYEALTGSASESANNRAGSKPIELLAHDPLRYVGDMLAWLHSAAVSEREALEVLFISGEEDSLAKKVKEGAEATPWEGDFDPEKSLEKLVDMNLEAVCKPLKLRIEQVIVSHDEGTLAYKISSLINFYKITFQKIVGEDPESFLMSTMKALEQSALRQFQSVLREHVRNVHSDLPSVPEDLSPPDFLIDALKELKVLMVSYDSSLVPPAEREAEFLPILVEALDPYVTGCEELSKDVATPQKECFVINCLLAVEATLEKFAFTQSRLATIHEKKESNSIELTKYLHRLFLKQSGLNNLLNALAKRDLKTTLSEVPEFSEANLVEVCRKLDEFLPDAVMDAQTEIGRIHSPTIIGKIIQDAAQSFVDDFTSVETEITSSPSFDPTTTPWNRTVSDVRLLLGTD